MLSSLRIVRRVAGLLLLFLVCAPLHLLTRWLFGRSGWPRRFLAAAAWLIGARVAVTGEAVRRHSLLIANHTSWLDILVLGGSLGTAFVSKDNLGHGFIHWLADQNHTVYVRREHRKGAKDQATSIARALERDQPVTVFPEGTTGPGTYLLPFRSTLLEAAALAEKDVELRPIAVDYGSAAAQAGWWHEPAVANILRLLGRKGSLPVTVRLLPALRRSDRKWLAANARAQIAAALGLQVDSDLPYRPSE